MATYFVTIKAFGHERRIRIEAGTEAQAVEKARQAVGFELQVEAVDERQG